MFQLTPLLGLLFIYFQKINAGVKDLVTLYKSVTLGSMMLAVLYSRLENNYYWSHSCEKLKSAVDTVSTFEMR